MTRMNCLAAEDTVAYVVLNANARYVQARLGSLTNLGRNTFNSPYFNIWNMGILKNNHITERFAVQLRVQAFDVFNHRNFTLGNLSVFQVTGNALNQGYTNLQATRSGTSFLNPSIFNGGSRVVEFGLKFTY